MPHLGAIATAAVSFAVLTVPACMDGGPPSTVAPDAEQSRAASPLLACAPMRCGVEECGLRHEPDGGTRWCGPCACPSDFTVCEVAAPVIAEVPVLLLPGETLTAQTSGLSTGADSVLHLLDAGGNELAMNDDIAKTNRASRIQFTNGTWLTKSVRLVVRAKSASTVGTATLTYRTVDVPVSLTFPDQAVQSLRVGDLLETGALPGDAGAVHVIYTMSGAHIVARTAGAAATAGEVSMSLPAAGTTHFLIGRVGTTGDAAPARIFRNDAAVSGHDPDQDGVGSVLEAAVGTCSSRSGNAIGPDGTVFPCALVADPRDSDGDGIRDDWELRGRLDVSPPQALSRWGADPRHKDIFVEVDFGQETSSESDELVFDDEAIAWGQYWADVGAPADEVSVRAGSIANPDGGLGVRLHADTGVDPTCSTWAALYGDWGGHGVVPPVPDGNGGTARMPYFDARDQFMSPARRGLFRYGLRVASGGGQTSGLAFTWGGDPRVAAHELGHTTGLTHDGVPNSTAAVNCKPNYPSIMNYGYDAAAEHRFSAGRRPPLDNASLVEADAISPIDTRYLQDMHDVFGHKVDFATGSVDWNDDGLFRASSPVESYANNHAGGSCEYTRQGTNQQVSNATTTVSPALAHFGGRTFVFTAGDGAVGYAYTTSALHCRVPSPICAIFPSTGQIAGLDSDYGADAVTLADGSATLVVGLSSAYTLRWTTIFGFHISDSTPLTTPIKTLAGAAGYDEPTLAIGWDGNPMLFYRDATGALFLRRYHPATDDWGSEEPLLDASGQPVRMALLGAPAATLAPRIDAAAPSTLVMTLAFAGPSNGCVQLWDRDPGTGAWSRNATALQGCGAGTPALQSLARPALAWVPDGREGVLHGRLHLVYRSPADAHSPYPVMQMTSVGASPSHMTIASSYDNQWTAARGVDLLFDPAVDDDLRAALTRSDGRVRFDPVADGITDYAYDDNDDWAVMRHGVCAPIVDERPSSAKVTCPD